ncbi:MAG TPA: PAS-domain containing protein [Rhizomicrobium sp.]|nr:PAS-domain containing protein [Rhizomicrobium sp.]
MRPTTRGQWTGLGVEGRSKRKGLALAASAAVYALLPLPAHAQEITATNLTILSTCIAAGAVALAFAVGLWALAEQSAARRLRRNIRQSGARARAAVGERDALISAGREAVVVWGRDGSGPFSYRGADAMLDGCLSGPDATALSRALDDLGANGAPFSITVRDRQDRKFSARGRAVGGMAAVWLEEEEVKQETADFEAVLNALPVPVWLRDKSLSLKWGNLAFLSSSGEANLEAALQHQASLDKSERDLAATAKNQHQMTSSKRFAVIGGHRRALEFMHVPLAEGEIVGAAIDATDVATAEAKLQQHIDAHADTLDKIATAVAIFGPDQKLTFYNRAYARLWELPETWLDRHPTDGEILDRLREARKLPEQRDYQAWKRQRLALYERTNEQPSEDVWHVPGGNTLRVVAQQHPFGGLTFLYEDVTERITLESSYNTLIKVQSATLDTLQEGVAVFGLDGRLKFSNAAFARIWDLNERDLSGEPHVRQIATTCVQKFGEQPVWEKLVSSIVTGSERRRDWGEFERNDHTVLSVALSPLPDGATLATFADVTDRFRIETALRDRNDALEAADKLKSDFIKHVSYELRTPLNTILGFAEHLASGVPGELSPRQAEYVQAIVTGGNTLRSLINDILDLSLIEAGALRLELERIDLHALLSEVAGHVREWAAKAGLELRLDCREDAGVFLADGRRIRQVVFNLLSNALKYTPRGGIITLMGDIQDEDVNISVADTGPGIAPEVKANVFERFAAKGRSGQRAGAGLGLALVNRFIELHDGWVEIDSRAEQGTIVRCHIPRRVHDGAPDDREIHAAE